MSGHKSLDDLEVVRRSGAGIAIICEGEEHRADEFYYRAWFAPLARQVTFFAQDGWGRVQEAVTELRKRGTPVPVFGLLDRDFTADEAIHRQSEPAFEGLCYRLPQYDLESYLLEPEGWFEVVKQIHRREPHLPPGWDDAAAVKAQIDACYRDAVPVAAYNWTVHRLGSAHRGEPGFQPRDFIKSVRGRPDEEALASWARSFGAEEEARATLRERMEVLRACGDAAAGLCKFVSGKLVTHALYTRLPAAPNRHKPQRVDLLDRYIMQRPEPPSEVAGLIRLILDRAERERSR